MTDYVPSDRELGASRKRDCEMSEERHTDDGQYALQLALKILHYELVRMMLKPSNDPKDWAGVWKQMAILPKIAGRLK
jgi:hypothetical protein